MQIDGRTPREIEQRLKEIRLEEKALLRELAALEARRSERLFESPLGIQAREKVPKTPEEKIALFAELFACREDVYPKLWTNSKTGAKGYSPACENEWKRGICEKPRVKCSDCHYQAFPP